MSRFSAQYTPRVQDVKRATDRLERDVTRIIVIYKADEKNAYVSRHNQQVENSETQAPESTASRRRIGVYSSKGWAGVG